MEQPDREAALLAQIKSEFDSWSKGDTLGYGRFAAEDITYFHNTPALPRMDGIAAFRELLTGLQGQIPPHDYEVVNPMVQLYGEVGVYTLEYKAFSLDGPLLAHGRGTIVYREAADSWEMVHAHWSVLDEA